MANKCTGKTFAPGTCGVVWRGANLKRISYCPLHAAAPDLLEAAKLGLRWTKAHGVDTERAVAFIEAAIAKAAPEAR